MADGNERKFYVLAKDLVKLFEREVISDRAMVGTARGRLKRAIYEHRCRRAKHWRPFERDRGEPSGESESEHDYPFRDSESDRTQEGSPEGTPLPKEEENAGLPSCEVSETVQEDFVNTARVSPITDDEGPPPPPELKPLYKRAPDIFVLEPPKMPCDMAEFRTKNCIYQPSPMLEYRPQLQRAVTFKDVNEANQFLDKLNLSEEDKVFEDLLQRYPAMDRSDRELYDSVLAKLMENDD